jgi:hypothetical protein
MDTSGCAISCEPCPFGSGTIRRVHEGQTACEVQREPQCEPEPGIYGLQNVERTHAVLRPTLSPQEVKGIWLIGKQGKENSFVPNIILFYKALL